MRPVPIRRPVLVALLAAVLTLALPTAAFADPAKPSNFESRILSIDPPIDGVTIDIVGGDAFLRVTAETGVEVIILGYGTSGGDEEEYVRIQADGSVFANVRSPAFYLNDARFGARDVIVPQLATPTAEPVFEQVGTGGTYAWHDHRIHWMSPVDPPAVRDGDGGETVVFEAWEVPLVVDGKPVTVTGELVWLPDVTPVVPIVAVIVAAGVGLLLWSRKVLGPGLAALLVADLGLVLAIGEFVAAEVDRSAATTGLLIVGLAAVFGVLGLAVRGKRPGDARMLSVIAVAAVGIYLAQRAGALTNPVLPYPYPDALTRVLFAAAAGLGLVALAGAARERPEVSPTEPTPPEPPG